MTSRLLLPLAAAALFASFLACEKTQKPKAPAPRVVMDQVSGGGDRVQARFGDGEDEQPRLSFKILKVYPKQAPSASAPFHAEGGEWTFLDLALDADPQAALTVGISGARGGGGIAFGKARIVSPSRDAGKRLVAAFARAFAVKPPPEGTAGTLEPVEFALAFLGSGLRRDDNGLSTGGTWHATKWFPALDGVEGEVFFNYDLKGLQAELSQKDADYDEDVLSVFATALRDGQPPERTPENDPTLSASGPTFTGLAPIGGGRARLQRFSGKTLLLTDRRPDGDALLSVDLATAKTTELAKLARTLDQVVCPGDDTSRCLIRETMPRERGVMSSDDPSRYWILEAGKLTALALEGQAKRDLTRAPLSPDGRYVAMQRWEKKESGPGAFTVVEILDRKTGKLLPPFRDGDQAFDVVGWSPKKPVAEVERGFAFDPPDKRGAYELDLETGKLTKVDRPLRGYDGDEPPSPVSPDGKRRLKYAGGKLVVTEGKKFRELTLNPADLRYAGEDSFEWVSPRYLSFRAARFTFVDTDTMKLSFPLPRGDKSGVQLSSDFKAVLVTPDDGGLLLGKVALPGP